MAYAEMREIFQQKCNHENGECVRGAASRYNGKISDTWIGTFQRQERRI